MDQGGAALPYALFLKRAGFLKKETLYQALYSGTEKRNGTPLPLTINKMTRRTWLRSDVGEKFV